MQITDDLKLTVTDTTEYLINIQNGTLQVTLDTDGAQNSMVVAEPSKLLVPADSTLTFALNGDTATITRL